MRFRQNERPGYITLLWGDGVNAMQAPLCPNNLDRLARFSLGLENCYMNGPSVMLMSKWRPHFGEPLNLVQVYHGRTEL